MLGQENADEAANRETASRLLENQGSSLRGAGLQPRHTKALTVTYSNCWSALCGGAKAPPS